MTRARVDPVGVFNNASAKAEALGERQRRSYRRWWQRSGERKPKPMESPETRSLTDFFKRGREARQADVRQITARGSKGEGEHERLLRVFCELARLHGHEPRPKRSWLDAMLDLLTRYHAVEVELVIFHSWRDEFWRGKVLSIPYMRQKFDTLAGQVRYEPTATTPEGRREQFRRRLARRPELDGEDVDYYLAKYDREHRDELGGDA